MKQFSLLGLLLFALALSGAFAPSSFADLPVERRERVERVEEGETCLMERPALSPQPLQQRSGFVPAASVQGPEPYPAVPEQPPK